MHQEIGEAVNIGKVLLLNSLVLLFVVIMTGVGTKMYTGLIQQSRVQEELQEYREINLYLQRGTRKGVSEAPRKGVTGDDIIKIADKYKNKYRMSIEVGGRRYNLLPTKGSKEAWDINKISTFIGAENLKKAFELSYEREGVQIQKIEFKLR